jgi:hypothetical protein
MAAPAIAITVRNRTKLGITKRSDYNVRHYVPHKALSNIRIIKSLPNYNASAGFGFEVLKTS